MSILLPTQRTEVHCRTPHCFQSLLTKQALPLGVEAFFRLQLLCLMLTPTFSYCAKAAMTRQPCLQLSTPLPPHSSSAPMVMPLLCYLSTHIISRLLWTYVIHVILYLYYIVCPVSVCISDLVTQRHMRPEPHMLGRTH